MNLSRRICVVLCVFFICTAASLAGAAKKRISIDNADLVGAGATFPAPLYQHWIKEFMNENEEFTIFYDAVGSGAGTKRFIAAEVDFGASDSAMNDDQIAQVDNGVQLIPATAGKIVLGYNIPDLKSDLRLSREVYTDIFLGKIRYWNDERIKALNPGVDFPRLNIVTVTRSDSSGTTWAFTNHLSAASPEWQERFGTGKKLDWPGNSMAARYNEGVAVKIRNSWGSIGYVEYGIAKRSGLRMAVLENKAGQFVPPSDTAGTKTLANTADQMPNNLRMFMPDPGGADSYPIITYSWLLLYKNYQNKEQAARVKSFVEWGLRKGQEFAPQFGYTPLPQEVVASAVEALGGVN